MQVIQDREDGNAYEDYQPVPLCIATEYDEEAEHPILDLQLDVTTKLYPYAVQLEDMVLDITDLSLHGGPVIEMPGCKVVGTYRSTGGEELAFIVDPYNEQDQVIGMMYGREYRVDPHNVFDISCDHVLLTNGMFVTRTIGPASTFRNVVCGCSTETSTSLFFKTGIIGVAILEGHEFLEYMMEWRPRTQPPDLALPWYVFTEPREVTAEGGTVMLQNVVMCDGVDRLILLIVSQSGRVGLMDVLGRFRWMPTRGVCKEVYGFDNEAAILCLGQEGGVLRHYHHRIRSINCEHELLFEDTEEEYYNGHVISYAFSRKVNYDRPSVGRVKPADD